MEGYAPDGTVYGSVSGVTQRDCPNFVKKLYFNPQCVYSIADYTSRYYVLMRMGIEQDITLIVTANPSTIVELQNNVNRYYDDYVNDIEKGTLKADLNIDPADKYAFPFIGDGQNCLAAAFNLRGINDLSEIQNVRLDLQPGLRSMDCFK